MNGPRCRVCCSGEARNFHYGATAPSCKACAMVFARSAKKKKPFECLKNPIFCSPSQALSPRQLCRKCRVDRCKRIGMKENLVKPELNQQDVVQNVVNCGLNFDQPFSDDRFPLMSQISKELEWSRRSMEHRFYKDGKIRGALEDDQHFHSLQSHRKLQEAIGDDLTSTLSRLDFFKSFSTLDLDAFSKYIQPYYVWTILAFRGFKNASKRQERWLSNDRNYILPTIYYDRSERALYTQAKRSLPHATHDDWKNIALISLDVRLSGTYLRKMCQTYWFPDDNIFYLLMYLLFVNISMKHSGVEMVKNAFSRLKNQILTEMEAYFLESNVSVQFMMSRVYEYLERVEEHRKEVAHMKTYVNLHVDIASSAK
ncbi:hypothetical protein QR680_014681 [Steinernema hermaphroditum]|uniref:Nuclear receptor domain-containing protein n=1 Tax=Steinernema hermaphroditum TaxID=289476 RepID=A0AA39ICD7_9BILA|nr:hypothetical protein QR680_014681 [Steinernema hermaphroditum]